MGRSPTPTELLRDARPRGSWREGAALGALTGRLFGRRRAEPRLSRYRLRRPLGAGGMGVVLAAWDPRLRREVAIKLQQLSSGDDGHAMRLRSEGRLLARLTHPNVVPIYDIGRFTRVDLPAGIDAVRGEGVFVVMELVEGVDLARWLATGERSHADVLERFVAAGRGLAAAHRAGIVHRDFKPSNVLLGKDGSVKVVDFGLASALEDATITVPSPSCSTRVPDKLTRTGTVMGTPAYMAPEQHEGRPVDARADQFAFCASLFEALAGRRLFSARSIERLGLIKSEGVQLPTDAGISRPIRAVLQRGLDPDPERRFRSMHDLLAQLQPERRRRLGWGLGLASIGLATALVGSPSSAGEAHCDDVAQAELDRVAWDRRRAEVSGRIARLGAAGPETSRRVEARLDAWTDDWRTARTETCHAREHEPGDAAARRSCLRHRLDDADVLLSVLETSDAAMLDRTVRVASQLSDPACDFTDPTVPDGDDPGARRVRRGIARARGLLAGARYDEARATIDEALAAAHDLGDPRLHAQVMLRRAMLMQRLGDERAAASVAQAAFFEADAADDPRTAAQAATVLVPTVASLGTDEEVERWVRSARARIARADDDPRLQEVLSANLGFARRLQTRPEEAIEHTRRALQIHDALVPEGDWRTAAYLDQLGSALQDLGRGEEALPLHERARAIVEREFGAGHPQYAMVTANLARVALEAGRPGEAADLAWRAVAIVSDPSHLDPPTEMTALVAAGQAELDLGHPEDARRAFERALSRLPVDADPNRLRLRAMRAEAIAAGGDPRAARVAAQSVLDDLEGTARADPPLRAALEALLAETDHDPAD